MLAFAFPFKLPFLPWAAVTGQNRAVRTVDKVRNTQVRLYLGFPTYCCMVYFGCVLCIEYASLAAIRSDFYQLSSCKAMCLETICCSLGITLTNLVKLGHFVLLVGAFRKTFVLFCFLSGKQCYLNHICCQHYFLQLLIFAIHRWNLSTLKIFDLQPA